MLSRQRAGGDRAAGGAGGASNQSAAGFSHSIQSSNPPTWDAPNHPEFLGFQSKRTWIHSNQSSDVRGE